MLAWLFCLLAFAGSIETARVDFAAPPSAAELAAAERLRRPGCGTSWGLLFPGLTQVCTGRPAEGAFLIGLTAAEVGAAGAALATIPPPPETDPFRSPGRTVLFVAIQDLWVYGIGRGSIDISLASRQLYTPPDELPEMLAAPFDPRVLKRPAVLGGIIGLSSAATAISFALEPPGRLGGPTNLFGAELSEGLGYPVALGLHGALMEHVAVAEEIAFRGMIQSGAARMTTEVGGWVIGSLVFGPFHALNVFLLPEDERVGYLTVAVPWITLTGSWLGLVYMWGDYTLTGPIAVHWWYNMLVSAAAFAANPQENAFSARIRLRW